METIAVVGLGYVGLPLAIAFAKKISTIGLDLSEEKVAAYRRGEDPMGEVDAAGFAQAKHFQPTNDPAELSKADIIIVAVPTPVDETHRPDFSPLISASKMLAKHMRKGAIIVYESTVYPGATEEVCVPVLEKHSGLVWQKDFFVGYSPERINPGDKKHRLETITKIVAGDSAQTLDRLAALYEKIIDAGVHRVSTIKAAEAAKVIENTQRDLNIALMNELSLVFHRLGIDTQEVLEAAGTKWNFLPFRPGLVGGHCIGVDPYYLTHKAEQVGYHPQVVLAGRRINDGMGKYVAEQTIKLMVKQGIQIVGAKIAVLGLTFKENCPDIRNTKVIDVIEELKTYQVDVLLHDPLADTSEVKSEYGLELKSWDQITDVDGIVLAVSHQEYLERQLDEYLSKLKDAAVFVDVKSIFSRDQFADKASVSYWRL